jgi:hypothetical protein
MTRSLTWGLFGACAAFAIACTGGSPAQVLTGKVTAKDAIAVRAVSGSDVVTAGRVHTDGSFTLSLPEGKAYHLEVLTSDGSARPILARDGVTPKNLAFDVCHASKPYDLGGVGGSNGAGPGLCPPPPPPCDSSTDPSCMCDPSSGACPPPKCDPTTDPSCMCDPTTGPCPPPKCDPTMDPSCMCDPTTGACPPPKCDPTQDPTCPVMPPPCVDPTDPNTCKDPCMEHPEVCACGSSGGGKAPGSPPGGMGPGSSGSGSAGGGATGGTCWPPPDPGCDLMGDCPCDGVFPEHAPGNFGCQESYGT